MAPPEPDGPSQSPADAARDGVVPALAELSVAERVSIVASESTPEGVWAISEIPTDTPDHLIGDGAGIHGTDFISALEYHEVLLLTNDRSRIVRAYPLPNQPAQLMLITDDAVYCARQGDGGLPDSMLCRIDRQSLDITGRIFPYTDESSYGPPEGAVLPHGAWTVEPLSPVVVVETLGFDGWVVTTGHDGVAHHDAVTLERVNLDVFEPTHRVVNVAADDTLNLRRAPGADEALDARLAPTYSGVRPTGNTTIVDDGGEWWEVELLDPVRLFDLQEPLHGARVIGWVNSAFLEPYDPAFSAVPACSGDGPIDSLTPVANQDEADHIFQIRQYDMGGGCLRVVVTFGTDFDDSGIAPRYDFIGTDMRPTGNVPPVEVEWVQNTTVIKLDGIDYAWATESSNVFGEVRNDQDLDAFSVRRADRSIDVFIPVIGWPQGVTTNPETGQLIVDILETTSDSRPHTDNGIHVIGEPVFTAGGVVEFMGLARPFEATVGVLISQGGELVIDDFAMSTDYLEAWGLFRYRVVGLDPALPATVTINQDSETEPVGVTFELEADVNADGPTGDQLINQSDLDVTDALAGFARGEVPFGALSFTDDVVLGLNTVEQITVNGSDLASDSTWIIAREEFDGLVGPFDVLGLLRRDNDISQVNVGPRSHCAGPPLDFGPEWSEGRHLVIEPTGIDSCLQWYAVNLLVNDAGVIEAVTLDLWGP